MICPPLPAKLFHALERELSALPLPTLQHACTDLRDRYTQGLGISSAAHRYAYLASRFPATYGVAFHLFQTLTPELISSLHTLLDLGSGAGSMAWAAHESLPHLQTITCFEKDPALITLGRKLAMAFSSDQVTWHKEDLTRTSPLPSHDIVTLSYVLNELSPLTQSEVIKRAYTATSKLLVIIEPGTPKGFEGILRARSLLLEKGAHILAPCPHHARCPLAQASEDGTDWCHFSVRLPREHFHRLVKRGSLPYEDEKYTYLIVSPSSFPPLAQNRIIKAPLKKTGHIILDLCTSEGTLARKIISKKEKNIYAKARLSQWGGKWKI